MTRRQYCGFRSFLPDPDQTFSNMFGPGSDPDPNKYSTVHVIVQYIFCTLLSLNIANNFTCVKVVTIYCKYVILGSNLDLFL